MDVCRDLIRTWIAEAEAGEFDDEVAAAESLLRHEARIASPERSVGQQAPDLSFVKAGSRTVPRRQARPHP